MTFLRFFELLGGVSDVDAAERLSFDGELALEELLAPPALPGVASFEDFISTEDVPLDFRALSVIKCDTCNLFQAGLPLSMRELQVALYDAARHTGRSKRYGRSRARYVGSTKIVTAVSNWATAVLFQGTVDQ